MDVPTKLYVSKTSAITTRIFHTMDCNGKLGQHTAIDATEENVELLGNLGYSLCKTCDKRMKKTILMEEQEALIEALGVTAFSMPNNLELRVYWHRDKGQPVELWSSR